MTNEVPLAAILKRRAERILRAQVISAYRVNNDPNLARCVLRDRSIKYVSFSQNREIQHTEIGLMIAEPDPPSVAAHVEEHYSKEDHGDYEAMIARKAAIGLEAAEEAETTPKKKSTRKKSTATKKKSATKQK